MANLARIEQFKAVFPVRPGVYHGSGVVCVDGRVLYVYVDEGVGGGGGAIRGVYFTNPVDLAHNVTIEVTSGDYWQAGKPVEDSDHLIIDGHRAAASVWRHGSTLYLTAMYASGDFTLAAATVDLRTELWTSPSGNGGDWVKLADLAAPVAFTGPGSYLRPSSAITAGVGTPLGGGQFAVPLTRWIDSGVGAALGWARPTVLTGSGDAWSVSTEHSYYVGGAYGGASTRRVVPHAGRFWWNSEGNVERDKSSSSADGSSWTEFDSLPHTTSADHPYLISEDGVIWRIVNMLDPRLVATADPETGPWEYRTGVLNMGHLTVQTATIGRTGGFLWQEISPSVWAMFNHDKVWFVFGGWLLGAIGRS